MAFTFGKQPLRVAAPNDAYLSAVSVYWPEKASQTFKANSPVQFNSGQIEECASPIVTSTLEPVAGIVLEDASGTTGYQLRVAPLHYGGVGFYANFMANTGTTNVLATADLGGTFQLQRGANFLGTGIPGWFLADVATNGGCTLTSFASDYPAPQNQTTTIAANGDSDARITGCFKAAVIQLLV